MQVTPRGRLPKKAAIEGCECFRQYRGWRCMSFRHQLDPRHLSLQYKLDVLVVSCLIRLSKMHSWDERTLARPPLELLADVGVSLHFASQLGIIVPLPGTITHENVEFANQQYQLLRKKYDVPLDRKATLRELKDGSYLIDRHPDLTFIRWKDADSDVNCSGCGGTGWDTIYATDGGGLNDWHTYGDCCLEEINNGTV